MFTLFYAALHILLASAQAITEYEAATSSSSSSSSITSAPVAGQAGVSTISLTGSEYSSLQLELNQGLADQVGFGQYGLITEPATTTSTGTSAAGSTAAQTDDLAALAAAESQLAASPSLTGTALSAIYSLLASVDAEESNYAEPTLTGTAAAAESAYFASEESYYATAYPTSAPTGSLVDACGPTTPDPTVPDSCDTPVEEVSAPASYGVQCLNDTVSNPTPVNITSCATTIPELCANQWQSPGQWVWLTANGCAIGSYLPAESVVGRAPWPSQDQCEYLIYASMVDECQYGGEGWDVAAVNLRVLPSEDTTGEQVNVGYGSYIVAERQLGSKVVTFTQTPSP